MDQSRPDTAARADDQLATPPAPIYLKRIRLHESELEHTARKLGMAAGTAVAVLREAQQRVNQQHLWRSSNPLSDLRTSARGRAEEMRQAAALRAQEWRRLALERTTDLHAHIERRRLQAFGRRKARARKLPFVMAAALGVLGFLLGVGFKAWKTR